MYPAADDQRRRRARRRARARRSTAMEQLAERGAAPRRCGYEWTELAFLQLQAGNTAMFVFLLAVRAGVPGAGGPVRELVAAAGGHPGRADVPALRRSPACCSRSMDINIFTQIGFVVLVGLACKNAILIVEFAKQRREAGRRRVRGDARGLPAAAAADPHDVVRVHPRRGAAGARRAGPAPRCGTRWAWPSSAGMLGVTLFGIFLTPVFYVVIQSVAERWRRQAVPVVPAERTVEEGMHA